MKDPCLECDSLEIRNLYLEQASKRSQENGLKYKHLFKMAPDAIFVADAETGILLEANEKAAELLGIPVDRIVGMHQSQLHPAEEREKYRILFLEHAQKKSTHRINDVYICNKDGENIPVQISTSVIWVDNQKIIYGIFRDITEQKETQQKINSLAKFPSENPDPVLRISKDGFVMYANAQGTQLLSELGGGTEQKTPKEWETVLVKAFSSNNPKSVEIKHAEKTLLFFFVPLPEAGYLNLYVRDITEQKRLEIELIENEKKYRELYRKAQIALYRTRVSDGKMLDCSLATSVLLGYTDEAEFLNLPSVTETYVDPQQRKLLLEALRKNKWVQDFQVQLKRKDGTHIWVSTSAEIFPEQDYLEGVMVDITATKVLSKAEKEILELIMQGKSNKEIAYMSERSVRTIEDHRANIMQKLGVTNIVELTQIATNFFNHDSNHDDQR